MFKLTLPPTDQPLVGGELVESGKSVWNLELSAFYFAHGLRSAEGADGTFLIGVRPLLFDSKPDVFAQLYVTSRRGTLPDDVTGQHRVVSSDQNILSQWFAATRDLLSPTTPTANITKCVYSAGRR